MTQALFDELLLFEFVSQSGNTQQWRSASPALEVVWRGIWVRFPEWEYSAVKIGFSGA
jgi:hypothetical protein